MDSIQVRLGNRIKQLRIQRNMSQEELAWRCQVSKNYISDVENGRRNVTIKIIEKLAIGLDVSLEQLFHF